MDFKSISDRIKNETILKDLFIYDSGLKSITFSLLLWIFKCN